MQFSTFRLLSYFFGTIFIIAGLIHWLIIFGVVTEQAPRILTAYFHSLAVLDVVAGVGILMRKRIGYALALGIMLTQIPAHTYMTYLDFFQQYSSGISIFERLGDILIACFFLVFYYRAQKQGLLCQNAQKNTTRIIK